MISLNDIKTIFFDYDGTIHNSIYIYAPAFQKAYDYLVNNGLAEERCWSKDEISYWLGFNPPDMWKTFLPNLSEEIRETCSNIIAEEMKNQVLQGKPVLYEGALEILEYLKDRGYHLVFISNCKTYYKDCHTELFKLDRYFEDLICSEQFNYIPKYEIVKAIKYKYPEKMVIIGDRLQDIEAGKRNNIYTVGCNYGYALKGELIESDVIIEDIRELKHFF